MDKETILAGNILIAKFMGFRQGLLGEWTSSFPLESPKVDGFVTVYFPDGSDMKFNTDWNWIMPVVIKISHIQDTFRITIGNVATYCKMDTIPLSLKDNSDTEPIIAVYKTVVEFIEWYNKQNKK